MSDVTIQRNTVKSRYEARDGEKRVGVLEFARGEEGVALVSTYVDPQRRGQGIAEKLVRYAVNDLSGEKIVPVCPYVQSFLEKHPELVS